MRLRKFMILKQFKRLSLFVIIGACSSPSFQRLPVIEPHLEKSVAIFHAFPIEPLPPKILQPMILRQEQQIAQMSIFKTVLSNQEGLKKITSDPALRRELEMYLETFTLTNISNMDISRRVAQMLDVEQFLIIHYELFPCTECDSKSAIWIRFQLIDAYDSTIIWSGAWGEQLEAEELENLAQTADKMSAEVLDTLPRPLKQSWHRKRYIHLSRLAIN